MFKCSWVWHDDCMQRFFRAMCGAREPPWKGWPITTSYCFSSSISLKNHHETFHVSSMGFPWFERQAFWRMRTWWSPQQVEQVSPPTYIGKLSMRYDKGWIDILTTMYQWEKRNIRVSIVGRFRTNTALSNSLRHSSAKFCFKAEGNRWLSNCELEVDLKLRACGSNTPRQWF